MQAIESMGKWRGESWEWGLNWRRDLFVWESDLVADLRGRLAQVTLVREVGDEWLWREDVSGCYSTKSAYKFLERLNHDMQVQQNSVQDCFKKLWKCKIPSKVLVFTWQVFLGRIPTKVNLSKRGIHLSLEEHLCVFCKSNYESENHLFLTCNTAKSLWRKVFGWLDESQVEEVTVAAHYEAHRRLFSGKQKKQRGAIIWHAVVWPIWIERNNVIFNNKITIETNLLDLVICRSWSWCISSLERHTLFSDWCMSPTECCKKKGGWIIKL